MIRVAGVDQPPLVIGVPGLEGYTTSSGIGRVLRSLMVRWSDDVRVVEVSFDGPSLPVLRNSPRAVRVPRDMDLVLLPRIQGAQALRDAGGVPSIAIVHDVGIVDFPGDAQGTDWITRRSIRRSFYGLQHASRIVAVSRFTENRLKSHLPRVADQITYIPDGVDQSFLAYDGEQRSARAEVQGLVGHPLGDPLLLYVGSELPRKNIRSLLGAFKQIQSHRPNAQLLKIGGAGGDRWRLETHRAAQEFDLRAGTDFITLDGIDDRLLAHAYRAADVFVSASMYEGFGLPALEAMAVGTPVVVTRCGAFPEVVGEIGWVAEPHPNELARMIGAALDDPYRQTRTHEGRIRAATYDWSHSASQYLALFHDIRTPSSRRSTISV